MPSRLKVLLFSPVVLITAGAGGLFTEMASSPQDYSATAYEQARRAATSYSEAYTSVLKEDVRLGRIEVLRIVSGPDGTERPTSTIVLRRWEYDGQTEWQADSGSCAAVDRTVAGLAWLSPPRIRPADLQGQRHPFYLEGPPDAPLTGGPSFTVKALGRFENLSVSRLVFTAGPGSAVDRWFAEALAGLERCWQPETLAD